MIYKLLKTIAAITEDSEPEIKSLEIDDLIPFNQQSDDFKGLFNSINLNNIAEFDNATVILFPETGRVIISNK